MQFLEFILGLLPIIWLAIALTALKMPAYKACPIALVIAIVLALAKWQDSVSSVVTGGLDGAVMALWPISLVIVAAIFTYNLCVRTGAMDKIKEMLTAVSNDKRVLVLILGWGFGGFMEGMAGFGTAVAIPAGILTGLGFNPIMAAVVCLVANMTPTAFGSIGIPTVTAANVAAPGGIDPTTTAGVVMLQMCLLVFITPFLMTMMTGGGFKGMKGAWGVTLVSALSFVIPQFLTALFIGPELPNVIASIVSMACTILYAKKFMKKTDPKFALLSETELAEEKGKQKSQMGAIKAWAPFILIFILLLVTSSIVPPIHNLLSQVQTTVQIYQGGPNANPSTQTFSWITAPGVLIFISAFVGGLIQKASWKTMGSVLAASLKQMSKTIITLVCILAAAKIMGYSGMTESIATFLATATGIVYPFFAPLIGSLGTFVTGSATSSSVLFAQLQYNTAQQLGMNPYWLVAANGVGATAGKAISPQSIAIATASTDTVGEESKIMRKAIPYYVAYVVAFGLIALFAQPLVQLIIPAA